MVIIMDEIKLHYDIQYNQVRKIANKEKMMFELYELVGYEFCERLYDDIKIHIQNGVNLLCLEISFYELNSKSYIIPCVFFKSLFNITFMPLYVDVYRKIRNKLDIYTVSYVNIRHYTLMDTKSRYFYHE